MKRILFLFIVFLSVACTQEKAIVSLAVVPEECSLAVGDLMQLETAVSPEDYAGKIVWVSSDLSKAAVDENGLVEAIAPGHVTITATCGKLTATCAIDIAGTEVEIGDYLFSDGTCSDSPQSGKDIIGVVFWAGDPTAQDAALKREHPECTHGLAVAVDGDGYSAWQSDYSAYGSKTVGDWIDMNLTDYASVTTGTEMTDNINKTVGYNNTKAMERFNAAPENASWKVDAVEKAVAYRNYCPAPDNTSDWYVPSVKELSLLCSGEVDGNVWDIKDNTAVKEMVNAKLSSLRNADELTDERYWSSSEADVIRPYYVNFEFGLPNMTYVKDTEYLRLRFIIAF